MGSVFRGRDGRRATRKEEKMKGGREARVYNFFNLLSVFLSSFPICACIYKCVHAHMHTHPFFSIIPPWIIFMYATLNVNT